MQFDEDASRPTVCKCGHGEMYHRLDTEAPLAKLNIPGASKCIYCSKAIVSGNGFSGWYNEVQNSDGALCHVECWEQYKDSVSAKCIKCLQPLRKRKGFSREDIKNWVKVASATRSALLNTKSTLANIAIYATKHCCVSMLYCKMVVEIYEPLVNLETKFMPTKIVGTIICEAA